MSVTNLQIPIKAEPLDETIVYPESDGKPMADNSKQFRWITTIEGNVEILVEHDPNVFVAGDIFWYPVEGHPEIGQAPDVMVAFGRPQGDRGSYLQWREENIAIQIVFEILSPGNRKQEMDAKFDFYERYGVEEYYIYDPDRGRLQGWLRNARGRLAPIAQMNGWRSPRLGIHFEMDGTDLRLYYPDGSRFLTFVELNQRRMQAEARALDAEARAQAEVYARTEAEERIRELEEKLRQAGLL